MEKISKRLNAIDNFKDYYKKRVKLNLKNMAEYCEREILNYYKGEGFERFLLQLKYSIEEVSKNLPELGENKRCININACDCNYPDGNSVRVDVDLSYFASHYAVTRLEVSAILEFFKKLFKFGQISEKFKALYDKNFKEVIECDRDDTDCKTIIDFYDNYIKDGHLQIVSAIINERIRDNEENVSKDDFGITLNDVINWLATGDRDAYSVFDGFFGTSIYVGLEDPKCQMSAAVAPKIDYQNDKDIDKLIVKLIFYC